MNIGTPVHPTLILSPDGSRDRNGAVPVTYGTNTTIVQGRYGKAWRRGGAGASIVAPKGDFIDSAGGAIIVRGSFLTDPETPTFQKYFFSSVIDSNNRVYLGRRPSPNFDAYTIAGLDSLGAGGAIPNDTHVTLAMVWKDNTVRLYRDGVLVGGPVTYRGNITLGNVIGLAPTNYTQIESVLVYGHALSDTDIARISGMPKAWTWENTKVFGAIEVPRTAEQPVSASYTLRPKLWRVTRDNEFIEDITDHITKGKVSFDPDRAIKWSFDANLSADVQLQPFKDFIAPYLTVEYADGHTIESQFGIYTTVPPSETITPAQKMIELDSRDLTWIPSQDIFVNGYTVGANSNVVATVKMLVRNGGFKRINIPDTSSTLGKTTSWKAGTSRLTVINDLLKSINYYTLFMDKTGYLASMPYVTDKDKAASIAYDTTDPRSRVKVLRTIHRDTTPDRIANRIVVIGGASSDEPIVAEAINNSPNSPTSYQNLGNLWVSKVYEGVQVNDQEAANQMAQRYLDTASQEYHRLTLDTSHDVAIEPYAVYRLNIVDVNGNTVADGVWNSRGWSMGFTADDQMTHEMSNIDSSAMELEA